MAVTAPSSDAVCGPPVNLPVAESISNLIVSDGLAPVSLS